jgi:hypothetical protein
VQQYVLPPSVDEQFPVMEYSSPDSTSLLKSCAATLSPITNSLACLATLLCAKSLNWSLVIPSSMSTRANLAYSNNATNTRNSNALTYGHNTCFFTSASSHTQASSRQ